MVEQARAKRRAEQVSGGSNIAYDLTALLKNKLKGIAANEEYKLDARRLAIRRCGSCWTRSSSMRVTTWIRSSGCW